MADDRKPKLLDVIALTVDVPEQGVYRGQVGTLVEELAPDVYEVEFSDRTGQPYAMFPVRTDQMMLLHFKSLEPWRGYWGDEPEHSAATAQSSADSSVSE